MKLATIICFVLFVAGTLLCIGQMWFEIWRADLFMKIEITIGAFFIITFIWAFLMRESRDTKRINNDDSLS